MPRQLPGCSVSYFHVYIDNLVEDAVERKHQTYFSWDWIIIIGTYYLSLAYFFLGLTSDWWHTKIFTFTCLAKWMEKVPHSSSFHPERKPLPSKDPINFVISFHIVHFVKKIEDKKWPNLENTKKPGSDYEKFYRKGSKWTTRHGLKRIILGWNQTLDDELETWNFQ